ncbi:MAG: AEC family transporter [Oscillospiraceae bacterium]|nr:AEC family transporter [Oscillospiraceae bacterium]
MSVIILNRLAVMLAYMLPGYVLYKKHIITDLGAKDIGKLLLYIILPSAIINSYNIEFSAERAIGLLASFLLAALTLFLSIIISRLIFGNKKPIEHFGAAFSNAGFMGIPLVSAVIGNEAVYYAAAFVAMLNILQWTYGVYIMTGSKAATSPKKLFCNPVLVSFFIGIVIFFLPMQLPAFFSEILGTISAMNAPIAMLTIGIYLAQVSVKSLFTEALSYKASAVRLLVIPICTAVLLALLPLGDYNLKQTILILASAPIGSNVAVYAQIYNCDYKQAVKEVVLSTLLCIVSMPVVIGISDYILQNIL